MRILQFSPNYVKSGGLQTHAIELGHWLRERGHMVRFAGDPKDSRIDPTSDEFIPLNMSAVSNVGGSMMMRVIALLREGLKLRRAIGRDPVDLIHAHETAPALVARIATFGRNIPVVFTFHGSEPERVPEVAGVAKRCADLTASPSKTSLDALIEHGVEREKSRHLGLGIPAFPDVPEPEIKAIREKFLDMAGTSGPLVLALSRAYPQKGVDVMVKVARRVLDKHPETVFVVGGGGPLEDDARQWARNAELGNQMIFAGHISTVPAHLKAADVFLNTSRWEASPISIVEAFRAGLPVVATDCGGVKELVDDSVGGLCPVEDDAALAEAVIQLVGSEDTRRAKAEAALKRSAEARFDVDSVYQTFEQTYQDLIAAA